MQCGYPYLIRLSFFQNPAQSGSGSEIQKPVGSRSGNRIISGVVETVTFETETETKTWLKFRDDTETET